MVFGCAPVGKTMRICPEEIFAKELTILGTKINPFTFPDATNLVANMGSKYIDYEKLGIGVYDLEDYQEALVKLKQGRISKIIFKMEDWDLFVAKWPGNKLEFQFYQTWHLSI